MSEDSKKFTLEEKTKIALKAASGDEKTMAKLAKEYGVAVEKIEEWIHETDVTSVPSADVDDEESVSLLTTQKFSDDYEYGATPDKLNYNTLFFWTGFGTIVILLFIVSIFFVYDYTYQSIGQQSSEGSQFYQINELRENQRETLNSFGVVDLEEGIYRIPIDSAISRIANDSE